jgi:hypothetical protein
MRVRPSRAIISLGRNKALAKAASMTRQRFCAILVGASIRVQVGDDVPQIMPAGAHRVDDSKERLCYGRLWYVLMDGANNGDEKTTCAPKSTETHFV